MEEDIWHMIGARQSESQLVSELVSQVLRTMEKNEKCYVTEGTKKERKIIPISGVEELLAFEPKEYSPKEELLVFEPNVGQCHNWQRSKSTKNKQNWREDENLVNLSNECFE